MGPGVRQTNDRRLTRWVCLCAAVWGVPTAFAQTQSISVSQTDAYGNVRPAFLERRETGLFATQAQFDALRSFQERGRRNFNRGGQTPFTLAASRELNTGGGIWQDARRIFALRADPVWGVAGGRTDRFTAFRRFGGFDTRQDEGQPAELLDILGRSNALTQANALNAPIDRAMWRLGTSSGFASLTAERPFSPEEVEEVPVEAPTLGEHVRQRTQFNLENSLERAWEAFGDGEYRRSLRLFQAASILGRDEGEPLVGEALSHLLSGSVSAATVHVRQLARRLDNPFMVELPPRLRNRLADDAILVRSLLITRRFSEANADTPEAVGLHVFLLWFAGQQEDAIRIAGTLPGVGPLTPFADWPEKLETALQTIWVPGG
ncbi:MAG: hypothetical protein ACPGXK_08530 [Phycisphaerae bacterium]